MNPLQRYAQGREIYPRPDVPVTATELRSSFDALARRGEYARDQFLAPLVTRLQSILRRNAGDLGVSVMESRPALDADGRVAAVRANPDFTWGKP